MGSRSFTWLDVFTDRAFAGNPLAVFPEAEGLTDRQMATIARELNLSETTFVMPATDPASTHRVRIFTPSRELPFAGHPTVGTAVALAEAAGLDNASFVFELGAGLTPVDVWRRPDGVRQARFTAPQTPRLGPAPLDIQSVAALAGLSADDLDPEFPVHLSDSGGTVFLMVVVRGPEALGRSHPVGAMPGDVGAVGIYLACRVGAGWQARMFAPEVGVVEDPATGSATCSFAGTLHRYAPGHDADGTYDIAVRQGVEMGRPSELALSFDVADGAIAAVRLSGAAVPVLRGEIIEPAE